jgi:hypothetical protein
VSDEQADAREIAFLVAKGDLPQTIAQKTDLPLAYVENLTQSKTFEQVLFDVGGEEAVKRWDEYQLERKAHGSLRTKVRGRVQDYFVELDEIAMDRKVKPEVRKDIMFRLMDLAKIGEAGEVVQTQELPPSFFTALAQATEEIEQWKRKHKQE